MRFTVVLVVLVTLVVTMVVRRYRRRREVARMDAPTHALEQAGSG